MITGSGSNLSQNVTGNTRYLVHFDDQTGVYGFVRYPASLDWLVTNGLSEAPREPAHSTVAGGKRSRIPGSPPICSAYGAATTRQSRAR